MVQKREIVWDNEQMFGQFSAAAKKKTNGACDRCRKSHRKCITEGIEATGGKCIRCSKFDLSCSLVESMPAAGPKTEIIPTNFSNEDIYAKVLEQKHIKSQYITSTQPLAPILSKDSVLCLDGEVLGLYCPWRDINYDETVDNEQVDPDLKLFLKKKGAFELPPMEIRRRLVKCFYDNIYPIYPVVDRDQDIETMPLLLLNSIMLIGVRHDPTYNSGIQHRIVADTFKTRCKYLEMIETNKITLLQSYLLRSIHEEGPEGPPNARINISKAIMLVSELGIHNLGETNELDNEVAKDSNHPKFSFKHRYDKKLLTRLFWVSYCCDRYISVTTGSAMIYHNLDLLMEDPSAKDFKEGIYQRHDSEIFLAWYQLCCMLGRILYNAYRPPGRRDQDDKLEIDILSWEERHLTKTETKYESFLKLVHCLCALVYLRSKIGVLNLIETNSELVDVGNVSNPMALNGMKYVLLFSDRVMDILENQTDKVEHIIVIHALLHVLVIIHLECEVKIQTAAGEITEELMELLRLKRARLEIGLGLLSKFRTKWWFAGAACHLFTALLKEKEKEEKPSPNSDRPITEHFQMVYQTFGLNG